MVGPPFMEGVASTEACCSTSCLDAGTIGGLRLAGYITGDGVHVEFPRAGGV